MNPKLTGKMSCVQSLSTLTHTLRPSLPSYALLLTLKTIFAIFLNLPPGLNCTGGQRHHQLQATGYPPAGHPCQPVWLPHREGRGQDKGDQGGEHPEHKSSPCSMPTLHRKVHIWNIWQYESPRKEAVPRREWYVFLDFFLVFSRLHNCPHAFYIVETLI